MTSSIISRSMLPVASVVAREPRWTKAMLVVCIKNTVCILSELPQPKVASPACLNETGR